MSKLDSRKILVSNRQKGNPLLNLIKNVSVFESEEDPIFGYDFVPFKSVGVLFLAVSYHKSYPDYIKNRMQTVQRESYSSKYQFKNRILLVQIDVKKSEPHFLKLTELAIEFSFQIVLSFDNTHAADILKELKLTRDEKLVAGKTSNLTNKNLDDTILNEKLANVRGVDLPGPAGEPDPDTQEQLQNKVHMLQLENCFQNSKAGINATDTKNLILNYQNLAQLCKSDKSEFIKIRGFGNKKSERLELLLDQPFCSV